MRPVSTTPEHRGSSLLSREENEQVFRLLGNRCQTLASGVVQLFLTEAPDHSFWRRKDAGVLCLVKDNQRRSYFFRLYCLTRRQLLWEHEVYNSMEYRAPRSFLHTFEAEDCIVAFNFAHDEEALVVRNILLEKLEAKKRRSERRSRHSMTPPQPQPQQPAQQGAQPWGTTGSHLPNGSLAPSPRQQHRNLSGGNKKKDKDAKRRLTKADIGMPQDFRHIAHVGWDPNKGFDVDNVEDPQLKQFFVKAGVSDSQLQDRETREFIYDFINKHGGIDAVKDDFVGFPPAAPPPVPARSAPPPNTYQTRSAPPPPPSRTGPLPPPPPPSQGPTVVPGAVPPPPTRTVPQRPELPQVSSIPAPPPPPPPPPSSPPEDVHTAPLAIPQAAAKDSHSTLMESIRSGRALKHVEVDSKKQANNSSDSRGDLLDQIRQGVELKAVQVAPRTSNPITTGDSLAGALARALAERSRVCHSDSSSGSDDEDEDDEEWED